MIGIPWAPGAQGPDAYDCWAFAAHVQATQFGRELPPVAAYGIDGVRRIAAARRAWRVVDAPIHGDLVEMRRQGTANHIGVWLEVDRGGVLHCQRGAGVCFDRPADIRLMGWRARYWTPMPGDWRAAADPTPRPRGVYIASIDPLLAPDGVAAALAGQMAIPVRAQTGESVDAIVARAGLSRAPVAVFVRVPGQATGEVYDIQDAAMSMGLVARADWDTRLLGPDEAILIQALPMGGDSGSNPIALVLQLAVLVAAFYFAPYLAPALVGALGVTSAAATSLAFTAISLVGSLAINALLPPPSPTGLRGGLQADISPTYSASAQAALARPGAPIPVCYGRHIHTLDDAAPPYVRYVANDQVLHQLLCLGEGDHELEEVRLGEVAILRGGALTNTLPGVTLQHVRVGQPVTLIDDAVLTQGDIGGQTLEPEVASAWAIVTPVGIATDQIEIDIGFSQLVRLDNAGNNLNTTVAILVQAQTLEDDDTTIGGVITLGTETFTDNTRSSIRVSRRYIVPEGRYQVRLTRTTPESDDQTFDTAQWIGLKAVLPGGRTYGDVELLALRIVVGEQIAAQSARAVAAIKTRALPVYSGGAWTAPQPTRAIAWAIADTLRRHGRLGDIDLPELLSLHATWEARGDRLDVVIDQDLSLWEAIQGMARAGRAQPDQTGSRIRLWRDEPRALPRQLFTDRNILRGSLVVRPTLPTSARPDRLVADYLDERTWRLDEVSIGPIGGAERRERYFGIASERHLIAEVAHDYRAARYRTLRVALDVELEARLLRRGDLIALAHRTLTRAQAVGIEEWVGTRVTLTGPVDWATLGDDPMLVLSAPDASVWGPVAVSQGDDPLGRVAVVSAAGLAEIVAQGGPYAYPATWVPSGPHRDERVRGAIGPSTQTYMRLIVESVGQERSGRATLTCLEDDPRAHDGPAPVTGAGAPTLAGLDATRRDEGGETLVDLVGILLPGQTATEYLSEYSTDGGTAWVPAATSATPIVTLVVPGDVTHVRMAAVGSFRGPFTAVPVSTGAIAAPTDLREQTPGRYVSLGSLRLVADAASGATAYQWRLAPDAGATRLLRRTATPDLVVTGADLVAAGARSRSLLVGLRALSATGASSAEITLTLTNPAPAAPTNLAVTGRTLTWDPAPEADVIGWDVRVGIGDAAATAAPTRVTTPTATGLSGDGNVVSALVTAVDRIGAGPAASITYGVDEGRGGNR